MKQILFILILILGACNNQLSLSSETIDLPDNTPAVCHNPIYMHLKCYKHLVKQTPCDNFNFVTSYRILSYCNNYRELSANCTDFLVESHNFLTSFINNMHNLCLKERKTID